MNNEPVAWMLVDASWNDFCRYSSYPSEGAIPLYTHPVKEHDIGIFHAIGFDDGFKANMQRAVEMNVVKELTDEEIIACIDEIEPDTADMIRFARAILRKASEK